ncbi:MAG: GTPase HflX [Lachnospiraceae bacterium]
MEDFIKTEQEKEKVILVAVSCDDYGVENKVDTETSLDELAELVDTAGAVTVGRLIQNREKIHNGTYIGKGKIEELKALIAELEADAIVTDDELTPAQMRNLEDELDVKICDRTMLILDIFAKHAVTREGKIQVELAQLKYSLQRLTGKGIAMSRLGGGIGTRGPGEKKLEQDRRLIRDRISRLKEELREIVENRKLLRKQRERNAVPVIAIVGYTNAGKSTLLNKLTSSDILAADMLFATLDATTRKLKLESGQEILLTDTVGFINKLPHHLIEAFRSTLEEASFADVILHVVDASNPNAFSQMAVVYETLGKLGADGKPVITALNKQDKVGGEPVKDLKADQVVKISAKTGQGLDELKNVIETVLKEQKVYIEKIIPYSEGGYLNQIRKYGQVVTEDYRAEGVFVQAYVPKRYE